MKIRLIIAVTLIFALFLTGCSSSGNKNDNNAENTSESMTVSNDDGVIDPEKLESLEDMLSKLNTNTTMQDVVSIFGKAPCMKPETNSDSWEYYCGDTTITLTGINNQNGTLFQAVVNDGNSSYELDLTDYDK